MTRKINENKDIRGKSEIYKRHLKGRERSDRVRGLKGRIERSVTKMYEKIREKYGKKRS